MKQLLIIILAATLAPGIQAQEKNLVFDANAQVRKVTGYTGIDVSGTIDLYLSQGNEEAVAVSSSSNDILDRIRTEVRSNILHIYFDAKGVNWKTWRNNKMKAYVTFKTLNHIEASGASNVKLADPIKVPDLAIEMSGASDFTGVINVARLKLEASGASHLGISGTAEKTDIQANGASDIKAYDLNTDFCKIDASGASVIRISVNKELTTGASGGSTVFYRGAGSIRNVNTSGGATVKRITGN